MKVISTSLLLFVGLTICNAQVGIGTSTPNASAQLDVSSTSKGFLPPRLTAAQRDAISSPAAGLMIWCTNCGYSMGEMLIFDGVSWKTSAGATPSSPFTCGTSTVSFTYGGSAITYGTVSGAGGKCWLDRNLGAIRAALSSTDYSAYGDLFQWGRGIDGHQSITWTSSTQSGSAGTVTSTLSTSSSPGHGDFIKVSSSPYNWINPASSALWQGVAGMNNVCPVGWRLPTEAEWEAERASWTSSNAAGAFNSSLKLTMSGMRHYTTGSLVVVGSQAYYWASNISGDFPSCFLFDSSSNSAGVSIDAAAAGFPIRCIKN
jgi:uncharacterized protein (TIGR02145 family)